MVMEDVALSFIRTVTVGPGIQPGLLTPARECRALAGLCERVAITAGGEFRPALRTQRRVSTRHGTDDSGPAENPQSTT
jgi:hypothetical protein